VNADEHFFITESIRYARSLPYLDCLKYLRGMLYACGDSPHVADVLDLVHKMEQNDQQLELIASGQLRLGLDSDSLRPDRHRRPGKKGTE